MKSHEFETLVKECISEVISEISSPPTNWRSGFKDPNSEHPVDTPLRLKQGEEPFQLGGRWYVYVYDERVRDDVVYNFSSDMAIPYNEFQQMVDGMKKPMREVESSSKFDKLVGKQVKYVHREMSGSQGLTQSSRVRSVNTDGSLTLEDGMKLWARNYVKKDSQLVWKKDWTIDSMKPMEEGKSRSDEEKRRSSARRTAEIKSGYKAPKGGAIPSGKSKAKEKDTKKGRAPVKY